MLFLAIGLLVVGILVLCIAGIQVLFVVIDAARGQAVTPRKRPVDVALYGLAGAGLAALLIGIWILHAIGRG